MNSPDDDPLNIVNDIINEVLGEHQYDHARVFEDIKEAEAWVERSAANTAATLSRGLNPAGAFGLLVTELASADPMEVITILAAVITSKAVEKTVEQEAGDLGGIS